MDSGIGRIGSKISQVIFLPRAIRDIPRFERTSLPVDWGFHESYTFVRCGLYDRPARCTRAAYIRVKKAQRDTRILLQVARGNKRKQNCTAMYVIMVAGFFADVVRVIKTR